MPRSYWLFVLALGLVLASPSHGQETKAEQQKPGNNPSSQLERIAAAVEKLPIAPTPDSGCQAGQDDRESDLCAQWKAADAAAESARWSLWMLWVSGFGLLIGGGTLFAAWRAAHWAKDAALHTQAAANEAEQSRLSFIEAERAIIHAASADIGESTEDGRRLIVVTFVNRGRSAGTIVEFGCKGGRLIAENVQSRWTVVESGGQSEVAAFPPPEKSEILNVKCWIKYRSIGSQTYTSYFSVKAEWYDPPSDGMIFIPRWIVEATNNYGHPDDT